MPNLSRRIDAACVDQELASEGESWQRVEGRGRVGKEAPRAAAVAADEADEERCLRLCSVMGFCVGLWVFVWGCGFLCCYFWVCRVLILERLYCVLFCVLVVSESCLWFPTSPAPFQVTFKLLPFQIRTQAKKFSSEAAARHTRRQHHLLA